jgi:uncharacterized protein YecT (DUF1311 family)
MFWEARLETFRMKIYLAASLVLAFGIFDTAQAQSCRQGFSNQARSVRVASASAVAAADDGNGAPSGLSATFAACMARAGSQNIASIECLTAERSRQDRRLNKVYQELIGNLQGDRRGRMVEAQRAWLQLQQKDGAFEASIFDELGPMGNQQQVENEARAVSQRADLLEQYLAFSKP